MADTIESLRDQLRAALAANEADRTIVHDVLHKVDRAIQARWWITEGRGSYQWDDDRYRKEFEKATGEVLTAVKDLRRVCADLTNTPQLSEEVEAARAGIRLTIEVGSLRVQQVEGMTYVTVIASDLNLPIGDTPFYFDASGKKLHDPIA